MMGRQTRGPGARRTIGRTTAVGEPDLLQPESQRAAPNTGLGVAGWFAAFQQPFFQRNLAQKLAGLFALICIGQTVALVRISENSGPKPYFVEHDPRGPVYLSSAYADQYTPTAANNAYFLNKWASRVFTISPDTNDTLNRQIPAASAWTVGSATTELKTLVTITDPIAERVVKIKGLTRKYMTNSTSFSPDGRQAYLIFTTTESFGGIPQAPKMQLLTISFTNSPESLKPDEAKDNPDGMRILHFTVTPYVGVAPGA